MAGLDTISQINTATQIQTLLAQEQLNLLDKEYERLRNYREYWKLYKGDHWGDDELDDYVPTAVFNKCYIMVNKGIAFLVGKPPTINYPSPEAEKILAPYVNMIIENSGGDKFWFEAVQMGSVAGDLFLKPVYDVNQGGVRIQVCDSYDVSVKYSFMDYQNEIPERGQILWEYLDDSGAPHIHKEIWTNLQKAVYIDDELDKSSSGLNILGQVPIVHIRNMCLGKEVYGMSDIYQLEPLNKLLNAAIRRFRDDVDYHGDPITLLYGIRIGQLEKGEGKMWGNLPVKSKVENLELETDFPAQQKMIEYLDDALHQVGCVPKESVTGNKAISNTSGVALHMNNMPIIELADRKKVFYGPGFKKAIMMALDLMYIAERQAEIFSNMPAEERALQGLLNFKYEPTGITKVYDQLTALYAQGEAKIKMKKWNSVEVMFQDYLPKDKLIEMQLIKDEMSVGLLSRKGALQRLGKDNIEEILKEVDEDAEAFAKATANEFYGEGTGGRGNVTQGMRGATETPKGAAKQAKGK